MLPLFDAPWAVPAMALTTRNGTIASACNATTITTIATTNTARPIRSARTGEASGGICHASGYIRAVLKVAEGGFLDMTGHLSPVRWPEAHIEGTILIAVGARYG
jgi:hypothetical protein